MERGENNDIVGRYYGTEHFEKEFMRVFEGDIKMRPAFEILQNTNHSLVVTCYDNTALLKFIELAESVMLRPLTLSLTKFGAKLINRNTIHSTLKFPFEFMLPDDEKMRKISFSMGDYYGDFCGCELLIINEISMISAAMLDCINVILQNALNNKELFGGIRILLIGDPYQWPAIVDKVDKLKMLENYKSDHFSESVAFKELKPLMIDLCSAAMPPDHSMAFCLEKIRQHKDLPAVLEILNTRYSQKKVSVLHLEIDSTMILCFNKDDAFSMNRDKFHQLKTVKLSFDAEETGKFEWGNLKIPKRLELKEGTRMMLTQSQSGYWFGTLGYVSTLTPDKVVFTPDDGDPFEVQPQKWDTKEYKNYKIGKKKWITENNVIGTMTQYPLEYAWAISVYQSQGQTFENVYLYDQGRFFAPMMRYAALSRARSLEGLTLHKKLEIKDFKRNINASKFSTAVKREKRVKQILKSQKKDKNISQKKL